MRLFEQIIRFAITFPGLRLLGCLSAAIYVAVAVLSFDFTDVRAESDRPILLILLLFGLASAIYLVSLAILVRQADHSAKSAGSRSAKPRVSFGGVLGFSILFRLILLFSVPIQEIDYYRYLWDGRVLWQGHNPYQFSPSQIEAADRHGSKALSEVAELSAATVPLNEIFSRVHHRQVPTIYPPLAQGLFAACAAATPIDAPMWIHLLVLKIALLAIDVLILLAMRSLLRFVGIPDAWCVAYGWCPLAIKETANSAHVDGLAVLLTLLALSLLLRAARSLAGDSRSIVPWAAAGAALGLAVLSKTYPVILLSLAAAFAIAHGRTRALALVAACIAVVAAGYFPFVVRSKPNSPVSTHTGPVVELLPHDQPANEPQRPWSGLETYLSTWQMNDLLFMIVHENLRLPRPDANRWFVVVPRDWRHAINRQAGSWLARARLAPDADPAFLITQALMGSLLLGLVIWWATRVYRQPDSLALLHCAFLVLAWSWMLSSAQNPWYVLWFLPLTPFARCRGWFLVPCLAMVYYFRFWMIYQGMWSSETGECPAFDFGWVWLEHGVVLAALAIEAWRRRNVRHITRPGCPTAA